jgi:hypothetical protein
MAERITLGTLVGLTKAKHPYRNNVNEVKVDLSFVPGKGWCVTRDDYAGGGPYRKGGWAHTPDEAIANFQDELK